VAPIAERATLAYLGTVADNQLASKLAIFAIRAGVYAVSGAALGAGADSLNQFLSNVIDKEIIGRDVDLGDGIGRAAATGAVFGVIAGVGQAAAEARYLNARFGEYATRPEELQPIGTRALGAARTDPTAFPAVAELPNTLKVRAVLFTVTTGSGIVDASLEGAGY
jgi:hypothetical protein